MGKHNIQIPGSDGCIYIYDGDTGEILKLCDIAKITDLPVDVRETLNIIGITNIKFRESK
jgi:hypothetical protein